MSRKARILQIRWTATVFLVLLSTRVLQASLGRGAPDTSLVDKPSAVVYAPDVQFQIEGSAPGIADGYLYCLDGECACPPNPAWSWTPVDSPLINLAVSLGTHNLAVACHDMFPPAEISDTDPYPAFFNFCYVDPLDDQDEQEYNNDRGNATEMTAGKLIRGNNRGGGDDWFKIVNRQPGTSEMTVWIDSDHTVSAAVFDWQGNQLGGCSLGDSSIDPAYVKFGVYPGVYFVKIDENRYHGGDYELVGFFGDIPCSQRLEVNPHSDSSGVASNHLPWSTAMHGYNRHGRHDYYYFNIADVPTEITTEIKSHNASATLRIIAIGESGPTDEIVNLRLHVDAGQYKCSPARIIDVPGTYLLRVDGNAYHGGRYEVAIHSSTEQAASTSSMPPDTRITGGSLGRAQYEEQEFFWAASDDAGEVAYAYQTDQDPNNWSEWTEDISVMLSGYGRGAHWLGIKSRDTTLIEDPTPQWGWFIYADTLAQEEEYNGEMRFANAVEEGVEMRGNNRGGGDDWFVLKNYEPGMRVLVACFESAAAANVSFFDRSGNQLDGTSTHGDHRYGSCIAAAPAGEYYVRVQEDRYHGGDYHFVVGFLTPPKWWTCEMAPYNHDKYRANHLPMNIQVKGNNRASSDWYAFSVNDVPTDVNVWCLNSGDARIGLVGPDGSQVGYFDPTTGENNKHSWRVYDRGTYLVCVNEDRYHGGDYVMKWSIERKQTASACQRRPQVYFTGHPIDIVDTDEAEFFWYAEDDAAIGGFTYSFDGEEFSCKYPDNHLIISELTPGGHCLAISAVDNCRRVDKRPQVGCFLYADTERPEAESNDGLSTAETIAPGQWVKGNNKQNDDWYTFENTQNGWRHIIVVVESSKTVKVHLLDGSSFAHAGLECTEFARRRSFVAAVKPGRYNLKVSENRYHGGEYRIAFGYVDIPRFFREEYESNDDSAAGELIHVHERISGNNRSADDDWYKLGIMETPVPLRLWLRGASARVRARLWTSSNDLIGEVFLDGSETATDIFDVTAPGVYHVQVLGDRYHGGNYSLYLDPGTEPDWVRFPCDYSTYNDWEKLGKPTCWCEAFQADGDADRRDSGFPGHYRIFLGDLNLIVENWQKRLGDPELNPCADIDHKDSGFPAKYRVFIRDLNILVENWKKKAGDLHGNGPRPE